ncbi:hypothetical protein EalM132_00124 [Exiguobacterium phage vB_EalM-132]|nr:hypothetical protein EalM132_00124 [Exiguobacterium phage vB_EalM-132]
MKKYKMISADTGVVIECTEKYVVAWLARGFEVDSVVLSDIPEKDLESVITGMASQRDTGKLDVL